ncbi:MAG: hypothetical protein IKL57_07790 [Oscillospiraceae bacterium]|nr:hypothetical protein [Oscillospiraceae bacterium]
MDVKMIKTWLKKVIDSKQYLKKSIQRSKSKDLKHMDAEELKSWISGFDIFFRYKEVDGYIGPMCGEVISLRYGGKSYNAKSIDEAMEYPFFDGESLNKIATQLDDLKIFDIKDSRRFINAEILKEDIQSEDVKFEYMDFEGGAIYISSNKIVIWYKDDEYEAKSIDDAMSYPIFDGKALNEIAGKIKMV